MASQDELLGEVVQLIEVVRGIELLSPMEAQPLDILTDSVHVLDILLGGVGIVEAQVTHSAVLLCDAEVHADSLGMADM